MTKSEKERGEMVIRCDVKLALMEFLTLLVFQRGKAWSNSRPLPIMH